MTAMCGLGWLAAGLAFIGWWRTLREWRRSIDRLSAAWQRQIDESARSEAERQQLRDARFLAEYLAGVQRPLQH